jgi:3-dehydroquinate synthase
MNEVIQGNIFITDDISSVLERLNLEAYSSFAVIIDENTKEHCLPLIQSFLPIDLLIEVKSGEENKTLETCTHIWQELTTAGFDRKGLVFNLGGGVIGDMGGFCASTYKRGIDFIQLPTTLLSQVDASVGGKLGIDFNSFKNHIGVFNLPKAVIISPKFLETLKTQELRSGYAEVIKHALIADEKHWHVLKHKKLEDFDWGQIISHSVHIKANVTKQDPTEKGLRKILNFGHTIGHAIETFYLELPGKKLLHGEAIAIGMITEAFVAFKKGYLSEENCGEIKWYILSIYGKKEIPKKDVDLIIPLTMQDKKNEGKTVYAALLHKIGQANYNQPLTESEIRESISYYNG